MLKTPLTATAATSSPPTTGPPLPPDGLLASVVESVGEDPCAPTPDLVWTSAAAAGTLRADRMTVSLRGQRVGPAPSVVLVASRESLEAMVRPPRLIELLRC